MNIKLEKFDLNHESEIDELFDIFNKYFSQSPFIPEKLSLKSGQAVYYRAILNDDYIGISGIIKKTPLLAETVKTVVFKKFQNQGLGKMISMAIEEKCKILGFKKVMTTIYHFNTTMINIKLNQGYTIEGFHLDHEAPGFHEYSLGKILL